MSCHYSCSTCSSPTYMNYCLSCPPTRSLYQLTCICQSGYYQAQSTSCYSQSQAGYLVYGLVPVADAFYYTNIALFWIYIILIMCRVNSQKMRITMNFGQTIALLLYYPFLYDQLSYKFIWSISALNFPYLHFTNICSNSTQSSSYLVCKLFQYIWQPLIILPGIIICCIISYIIINLIYKNQLIKQISIIKYYKLYWFNIIYIFIDITAVIYSYNMANAILLSNWGYIQAILYVIIVVFVCYKYFHIVNSQKQCKLLYREEFYWAYGYDQNYHLHFIDFLYNQGKKVTKQQIQQYRLQHTQNIQNAQNIITQQNNKKQQKNNKKQNKQQSQQQKNKQIIQRYIPHSNLYIFELIYKIIIGASTALLYKQYKPMLIVLSLILLLYISMYWLGTFLYYDKTSLLIYTIFCIIYIVCCFMYWTKIFWIISIVVAIFVITMLGVSFVVQSCMNIKMNQKLVNKVFATEEYSEVKNNQNYQNNSQEELIKQRRFQLKIQQLKQVQRQKYKQNQQKHQTINQLVIPVTKQPKQQKQPQQQNSARKSKYNNSLQDLLKQPSNLQQEKPKKKSIFVQAKNQVRANTTEETPIKRSTYQAKLQQNRSKTAAVGGKKNTSNTYDEKKFDQTLIFEEKKTPLSEENRYKYNQTHKNKSRFSKNQETSILSHVLQQEKQEEKDAVSQVKQNNKL